MGACETKNSVTKSRATLFSPGIEKATPPDAQQEIEFKVEGPSVHEQNIEPVHVLAKNNPSALIRKTDVEICFRHTEAGSHRMGKKALNNVS